MNRVPGRVWPLPLLSCCGAALAALSGCRDPSDCIQGYWLGGYGLDITMTTLADEPIWEAHVDALTADELTMGVGPDHARPTGSADYTSGGVGSAYGVDVFGHDTVVTAWWPVREGAGDLPCLSESMLSFTLWFPGVLWLDGMPRLLIDGPADHVFGTPNTNAALEDFVSVPGANGNAHGFLLEGWSGSCGAPVPETRVTVSWDFSDRTWACDELRVDAW